MNKIITGIILLVFTNLMSQIPSGYYDNAQGLSGYQLKTALKNIIDNHTVYTYNDLYDIYETSDTDYYYENDGTVLDMYSEKPNAPDAYNYHHHQATCGQYSGEGDCYNREHIIPQSIFSSHSPMKSDAHFVVPTDGYVNNRRSSYPFGEVSNPTWISTNGSKLGTNVTTGYSGTVFEPIDEFKGDIARMIFYVATRYEDEIASWNSTDMFDGSSHQVFTDWFLQVLLSWNAMDPVSQREIDRNNAVYNYQENRNPFIDHPEWVNAIWGQTDDTQPPTAPTNISVQNVTDTTVDLVWNPATDDFGVTQYIIFLDGTQIGTTPATTYHLTGLEQDTSYQVCIIAQDAAGNQSPCSTSIEFHTKPPYIFDENFDNCPDIQFITISEASNKNWECIDQYGENNSPAMQINGYQADEDSKDWLITNSPINFDDYSQVEMSFYTVHKYGTSPLLVVYSTDYDGGNNPSNFTWNELPNISLPIPDGTSTEVQYSVTDADISAVSGSVYLAFKYFTQGYAPTRWTVDSVKLGATTSGIINHFNNPAVIIFPNPVVHSQIDLYYENLHLKTFEIYDVTGKLLQQNKVTNQHHISFSGLPQGIYFIKLLFDEGVTMKRFIIE